jgi:hypothetical protein
MLGAYGSCLTTWTNPIIIRFAKIYCLSKKRVSEEFR